METKICTQCKDEKSLTEFGVRNKKKNILHQWCRVCLNEYAKKYREENKNLLKKRQKKWYKTKGRKWKKIYDKNNLERTRLRDNERYHSDPSFRTKKILRSRLAKVLKGEKKSKKTLEYVGSDILFIRQWFEFQFDENMNWENQGTYWDVEHVIPCSAFDLSLEENIYKCFNWRNLRPYEKKANGKKGNKIIIEDIFNHKKKYREFELFYLFGTK
ncbi:intron-encoded nuclease [Moumouvirus australiensis]|uniref:Intron-encoded nuclease n=1 Tax=Moumouvirus australiensis TaxID=2109587 RepID=A0A2P1ELJ7_9VIRU|nr:intron-encoded nuclease [Moumouvirus australiensis]AVL94776.1 intron-encoded nuclease [Moumouvirus australiensis]